jgi:predicted PurR-regulated permease PerM
VNLNPLAIIIGMVVLGTVGGIVALIIAVPLIATAKILLHHSSYHSFAILFENEPEKKTDQ